MIKNQLLIYGCNGYTGSLISRLAKKQGLLPILAGRDPIAVQKLADELGLPWRAFDLRDQAGVDSSLADVKVVLHCAGPFMYTSRWMIDACLRNKVHYLDITGEIPVFEAAHSRDEAARKAGIMIMPGVGFDVVPTDCMALCLREQMPDASHLALALMTRGGRLSHGTAITIAETMGAGGAVRRDGRIVRTMSGFMTREIDFGFTKKRAAAIPWGDVSTAYYTTGIPNIRVYNVLPKSLITSMKVSNFIGPLLQMRWVKDRAIASIRRRPAGPDEQERDTAQSYVWGEVKNEHGSVRRALLSLPEGYSLTAQTSLAIAKRTLHDGFGMTGFRTPASVFGADFILGFPKVTLTDLS